MVSKNGGNHLHLRTFASDELNKLQPFDCWGDNTNVNFYFLAIKKFVDLSLLSPSYPLLQYDKGKTKT